MGKLKQTLTLSRKSSSLVVMVWKCSDVSPIYKKSDETNKVNYRPLSLLTALSRCTRGSCLISYTVQFAFLLYSTTENGRRLEIKS